MFAQILPHFSKILLLVLIKDFALFSHRFVQLLQLSKLPLYMWYIIGIINN